MQLPYCKVIYICLCLVCSMTQMSCSSPRHVHASIPSADCDILRALCRLIEDGNRDCTFAELVDAAQDRADPSGQKKARSVLRNGLYFNLSKKVRGVRGRGNQMVAHEAETDFVRALSPRDETAPLLLCNAESINSLLVAAKHDASGAEESGPGGVAAEVGGGMMIIRLRGTGGFD